MMYKYLLDTVTTDVAIDQTWVITDYIICQSKITDYSWKLQMLFLNVRPFPVGSAVPPPCHYWDEGTFNWLGISCWCPMAEHHHPNTTRQCSYLLLHHLQSHHWSVCLRHPAPHLLPLLYLHGHLHTESLPEQQRLGELPCLYCPPHTLRAQLRCGASGEQLWLEQPGAVLLLHDICVLCDLHFPSCR